MVSALLLLLSTPSSRQLPHANKKQRRRGGAAGHGFARALPWCPPSQATRSREGEGASPAIDPRGRRHGVLHRRQQEAEKDQGSGSGKRKATATQGTGGGEHRAAGSSWRLAAEWALGLGAEGAVVWSRPWAESSLDWV